MWTENVKKKLGFNEQPKSVMSINKVFTPKLNWAICWQTYNTQVGWKCETKSLNILSALAKHLKSSISH